MAEVQYQQMINNVFGMAHRKYLSEKLETILESGNYRFIDKDYTMVSLPKNEVMKKLEANIGATYFVDVNEFYILAKEYRVIISGFITSGETNKSSVLRVTFHGESIEDIEKCLKEYKSLFDDVRNDENTVAVQWYYQADGNKIRYELIPEVFEDKILPEAYPYITDLKGMIQNYMETPEPVLILIGEPGTGKTRLIRYIVKKMSMEYRLKQLEELPEDYIEVADGEDMWPKVAYATDAAILSKDQIFIDLLSGETFALVLEDMDVNLAKRTDGNEMMNKMLSVSDGFLCNVKTKIIITTNIKDVADIDSALLRPGRCFAIIETRALTYDEANVLLKAMGIEDDLPYKEKYTIAEVYAVKNRKQKFSVYTEKRIGFAQHRVEKPLRKVGFGG